MRALLPLVALTVLALAGPAGADELFDELARGVDVSDAGARADASARLSAASPDFWESELRAGPFRAAFAEDLTPDRVNALFRRAARDPEAKAARWAALAKNLAARRDLGTVLVEAGAVPVLAAEHGNVLADAALHELLAGEPRLASAALADAGSVVATADELLRSPRAEALRFLADAVTGAVALPMEARALLATVRPSVENHHGALLLGEDRIRALERTARGTADPALRLLAARLLSVSGDPAAEGAAMRAYRAARSSEVDGDELEWLGASFFSIEGTRDLPAAERFPVVHGALYLSHVRASEDFDDADRMAESLRRVLSTSDDETFRAATLRLLSWFSYAFVDDSGGPRRPVPALLALLGDLEAGRIGSSDEVRDLGRRIAAVVRSSFPGEKEWPHPSEDGRAVRAVSPVLAALPGKGAAAADLVPTAETIEGWLRLDPEHLVDPDVFAWLRTYRPVWLDLYPRAALERLLESPPTRVRVPGRSWFLEDPTGSEARRRLLRVLALSSAHRALLVDDARAASWPASVRRERGRLLHDVGAGPTADDETAAGWAERAVLFPRSEDLPTIVPIVTGASRPAVRAMLLDSFDSGPPERFAAASDGDDEWPKSAVPLGASDRAALVSTLRSAADPHAKGLAARLLATSGRPEDLDALLENGSDLEIGLARHSHPLSDLAADVHDAATLEVVLAHLAKTRLPPRARRELFANLWSLTDDEDAIVLHRRLFEWALAVGPTLDADLPEAVLSTVLKLWDDEDDRARALAAVRSALSRVAVPEIRFRLARLGD